MGETEKSRKNGTVQHNDFFFFFWVFHIFEFWAGPKDERAYLRVL